jgi:hypothetical protein
MVFSYGCTCKFWSSPVSGNSIGNARGLRRRVTQGVGTGLLFLCVAATASAQTTAQFLGAQSTISTSALNQPESVAVDGSGDVYIADSDNGRVLKESFSSGS